MDSNDDDDGGGRNANDTSRRTISFFRMSFTNASSDKVHCITSFLSRSVSLSLLLLLVLRRIKYSGLILCSTCTS